MKKIALIAFVLSAVFTIQSAAMTYCDFAGDTLSVWNVQLEYKEKYFEYNTFYSSETVTTGIMLRGMDQDFLIRMGLPDGYFASLSANYVFQNLEALYDYNNIQTLTFIAGRLTDTGVGILAGIRYPLGTKMAGDIRLINRNDMYNFIAGLYVKNALGPVKLTFQGIVEQPFRQTDYRGDIDIAASIGFNLYADPQKQSIDILAQGQYKLVQRGSGDSYSLTLIPQAVVNFYNDFSFVAGVEILVNADNWILNKQEKFLYVVKANYVLNSSRRASAAKAQMTPVVSGFAAAQTMTLTPSGTAVGTTSTPKPE